MLTALEVPNHLKFEGLNVAAVEVLQAATQHSHQDPELLAEIARDLQDLKRQEELLFKEIAAVSAASKAAAGPQVRLSAALQKSL